MIYKFIKISLFLSIVIFLSQNWAMEHHISQNSIGFNNTASNNDEIAQWVTHCLNFILKAKNPQRADLPQSKYDFCKDLYCAFCNLIDLRSDNKPQLMQDIISTIKTIISKDNILKNKIDQELLTNLDDLPNLKIVEIEHGGNIDNNSSNGLGKKEEISNNSSNYNFDSYDNKATFINYNLSPLILSTKSIYIMNNSNNKIPLYTDIINKQNDFGYLTSFEDIISKFLGDLKKGLDSNDSDTIINSLTSIKNIILSDKELKNIINPQLLDRINNLILAKQEGKANHNKNTIPEWIEKVVTKTEDNSYNEINKSEEKPNKSKTEKSSFDFLNNNNANKKLIISLLCITTGLGVLGYKFQDNIVKILKDIKNYPTRLRLYLCAQAEKVKSRWLKAKTDSKEININTENIDEIKVHA